MAQNPINKKDNSQETRERLWGQMLQEAHGVVDTGPIEKHLRSGGGVIICGLEGDVIIVLEEESASGD